LAHTPCPVFKGVGAIAREHVSNAEQIPASKQLVQRIAFPLLQVRLPLSVAPIDEDGCIEVIAGERECVAMVVQSEPPSCRVPPQIPEMPILLRDNAVEEGGGTTLRGFHRKWVG